MFEGSMKHAPAFARLNAPPTAGRCCAASLWPPSPPLATRANNALAQVAQVAPERRTLERRRRLERWQPPSPGPPAVVSSAYHLKHIHSPTHTQMHLSHFRETLPSTDHASADGPISNIRLAALHLYYINQYGRGPG